MNRALSWLTPLLLSSAVAATGCIDEGAAPEANAPATDGAYAHITGPDGAGLALEDGLVQAELRVGKVEALRTIGLKVEVTGGEIVEWTRDDAFLTSAGGQVVPLESRAADGRLSLVVGTTRPVSTEDGARLASFTVRPTADEVSFRILAEGAELGLVQDGGRRIDVATRSITLDGARR